MTAIAERLRSQLDPAYQLSAPLGEGGMGLVFRGRDVRLQRDVAIKVLHGELANQREFRERFIREARALALISHPHVLPVYYCAPPDADILYLVTELVDGPSLGTWLSHRGPLPWEVALALVERCLAGLAATHARNILHRDIKPANILVSSAGLPKLADFGVARVLDATTLTSGDSVVGTLRYLAPEALDQPPHSTAQDVYAMACVLFEALAGVPAFPQSGMGALVYAISAGQVAGLDRLCPHIWPEAVPVVETGLAREAADRYPSADAMRAAIAEVLDQLGLRDPATLCAGYFTAADRDAFQVESRARMREHLIERARTLSLAGRDVEAVELANRLPLLDRAPAAVSAERALEESRTSLIALPVLPRRTPRLPAPPPPTDLGPVARLLLVAGALALAPLIQHCAALRTATGVYLLGPAALLAAAALLFAVLPRPALHALTAGAWLGIAAALAWQPGEARAALPHAPLAAYALASIAAVLITRQSHARRHAGTWAVAALVPLIAAGAASLAASRVAVERLEQALALPASPGPMDVGLGVRPDLAALTDGDASPWLALDLPLTPHAPLDPTLIARLRPHARRLVLVPWFPRQDGRPPRLAASVTALLDLCRQIPAKLLFLPEELSIAPSDDADDPATRMSHVAAALREQFPQLDLGVSDELSADEELPAIGIEDVAAWADQPWMTALALPLPRTPAASANTDRLVTALKKKTRASPLWFLSESAPAPAPRAPWHATADRALLTYRIRYAQSLGARALLDWR